MGEDTEPQYLRLSTQDADLIKGLTDALNRFCHICETGENPGKRMETAAVTISEAAGTINAAAGVQEVASAAMVAAGGTMTDAATNMGAASGQMWDASNNMASAAGHMRGY